MIVKRRQSFIISLMLCLVLVLGNMALAGNSSDIKGHWAEGQISDWVTKGYIQGYPDGTFKPDNIITRAEFMTLVNKKFGFTQEAEQNFSDVKPGDWFVREIGKALAANYIAGYGDGTVKPNNPISRQEVALVIAKIMKFNLSADLDKVTNFKDVSSMPEWSKGAIGAVVAQEYMQGYPNGTFQAASAITRAETIVALNKIILEKEDIKIITPTTSGGVGGGGGGGGGNTPPPISNINNAGTTLTGNFTINTSNTYGPSSGSSTINGTLTVDPGSAGTVTLQNLNVTNLVILSGASSSIHLRDANVTGNLTVNAGSQSHKVRIISEGTTSINQTNVDSKAIIESTSGTFGSISINSAASNQQIELRGTIDSLITVEEGVTGVNLSVAHDSIVSTVNLNSTGSLTLAGQGAVQTINVGSNASGASITILEDANIGIQNLNLSSNINLNGNLNRITTISTNNGALISTGDETNQAVIDQLNADLMEVAITKDSLVIGYATGDNANNVTQNVSLSTSGANGTSISWASSNPDVVNAITGAITPPGYSSGDTMVTLIAIICKGKAIDTKTFSLIVKAPSIPPVSGIVTDKFFIPTAQDLAAHDPNQVYDVVIQYAPETTPGKFDFANLKYMDISSSVYGNFADLPNHAKVIDGNGLLTVPDSFISANITTLPEGHEIDIDGSINQLKNVNLLSYFTVTSFMEDPNTIPRSLSFFGKGVSGTVDAFEKDSNNNVIKIIVDDISYNYIGDSQPNASGSKGYIEVGNDTNIVEGWTLANGVNGDHLVALSLDNLIDAAVDANGNIIVINAYAPNNTNPCSLNNYSNTPIAIDQAVIVGLSGQKSKLSNTSFDADDLYVPSGSIEVKYWSGGTYKHAWVTFDFEDRNLNFHYDNDEYNFTRFIGKNGLYELGNGDHVTILANTGSTDPYSFAQNGGFLPTRLSTSEAHFVRDAVYADASTPNNPVNQSYDLANAGLANHNYWLYSAAGSNDPDWNYSVETPGDPFTIRSFTAKAIYVIR